MFNEVSVSVCCITYNHLPYIQQTLEGFLMQQTDFRFEIVVCDDDSSDGTQQILKEYSQRHPELIQVTLREKNIGMIPNFLDALTMCTGKYIALCEGDDFWTDPEKLSMQLKYMESNLDCSLLLCNVRNRYEYDPIVAGYDYWENQINANTDFDYSIEECINYPLGALTASAFFRKSALHIPPWYVDVKGGEIALFALLSKYGRVHFLNKVVATYRRQIGSISHTTTYTENNFGYIEKLISYYINLDDYFDGKITRVVYQRINYICYFYLKGLYRSQTSFIKKVLNTIRCIIVYPKLIFAVGHHLLKIFGLLKTMPFRSVFPVEWNTRNSTLRVVNTYGSGKHLFSLKADASTINLGEMTLFNKQSVILHMPDLPKEKSYFLLIHRCEDGALLANLQVTRLLP